MQQFDIIGMSCAACSARVEKAVSKLDGVDSCAVNLLTNSMNVEGTVSPEEVISAVTKAGYGANLKGERNNETTPKQNDLKDNETAKLIQRLVISGIFLIFLMYFSMGHTMFNFPLPSFFSNNPLAIGLCQLLLSASILIINKKFFISGSKSLLAGAPNMDTLVSLGSASGFIYSIIVLFKMTSEPSMEYVHDLYFESSAMLLVLITVGKMLESHSKGRTTDALQKLIKLAPKTAVILENGHEITIPIEKLNTGHIFVVRPGETIPADGIVIEGTSAVNEASITGESIPVDKGPEDTVTSATINQSGFLKCMATRVGEDTTLSQIIKMVSDASATKAPIAKVADKVSGIFVPGVITIAFITGMIWLILGKDFGFALERCISVLVISCPCALGLATPVAIMVGNGTAAKNGILFKNATALEQTGRTDIVVLDKTGTITKGQPKITDILPAPNHTKEELFNIALALESKSEHPLAKAITEKAPEEALIPEEITDFRSLPGNGVEGVMKGIFLRGGNEKFIKEFSDIPQSLINQALELSAMGKTPLFFAKDKETLGLIAVADTIKEDSPGAIAELKRMGLKVVMITGDNEGTAKAIGRQAGVDTVYSNILPRGKAEIVKELRKKGKVCMVGDGINDAPALTIADTGIAIGAGTDIAIDAADVVLMKSRLSDLPVAISLSKATLRNIHQNLFWAFIYNAIGIPLAAGLFINITGWEMNPMFGALAMSLSSFCVVSNALRLNFFKPYNKKNNPDPSPSTRRTLIIKGMMCRHCENRVVSALKALPQVENATADHKSKKAIVILKADIEDNILREAVTKEGYKVIKVK